MCENEVALAGCRRGGGGRRINWGMPFHLIITTIIDSSLLGWSVWEDRFQHVFGELIGWS